jgi:hypothetical protein
MTKVCFASSELSGRFPALRVLWGDESRNGGPADVRRRVSGFREGRRALLTRPVSRRWRRHGRRDTSEVWLDCWEAAERLFFASVRAPASLYIILATAKARCGGHDAHAMPADAELLREVSRAP